MMAGWICLRCRQDWSRNFWLYAISGFHQRCNFVDQNRQFRLDHAPDNAVVNLGIRMHEDVAKRYDAAKIRYLLGERGIDALELQKRFTDNGEDALNGEPEHLVLLVLLEGLSGGEFFSKTCCLLNVVKILTRLKPH